jgi:hypothetical protein
MPIDPNYIRNLTHEQRFGTTTSGNLPQYKVGQNLCEVDIASITYPDVSVFDFRYYHIKCPYSTQSLVHEVRNVDLSSSNYFKMEEVPVGSLTSHIITKGIMIKHNPGARIWGWLCVDDNCSYFLNTGKRYFYR